jgi:hypothetical protein
MAGGFGIPVMTTLMMAYYPIGSMGLLYMVTWIPSIYPSHVSIPYMDPMGIDNYRLIDILDYKLVTNINYDMKYVIISYYILLLVIHL